MASFETPRETIAYLTVVALVFSSVASATCTTAQQPPAGQAPNFDINAHLEEFDKATAVIDQPYPPDSYQGENATAKALQMVANFAPRRKYDLKNSQTYPSSQEFGNWFFGAAAQRSGYTESQALRAAAVVQQYQDFTNANNGSYLDMMDLAYGILEALTSDPGTGDNADDPTQISGGYSYAEDIYENDPNRSTTSNSCDSSSSSTGTANSSGSWGGGSFVSGFTFVGLSGCIGNCGPQGTVIVEDIVEPGSETSDN